MANNNILNVFWLIKSDEELKMMLFMHASKKYSDTLYYVDIVQVHILYSILLFIVTHENTYLSLNPHYLLVNCLWDTSTPQMPPFCTFLLSTPCGTLVVHRQWLCYQQFTILYILYSVFSQTQFQNLSF